MKATVMELRDADLSEIPNTYEEYWAKVQANNEWYFSVEATVFRMWTDLCIFVPEREKGELKRSIALMVSNEKRRVENGVPKNLRSKQ